MLSVAIIAKDEERHIAACLDSIADLADEVVVLLDDRSCDATEAICRAWGATVYREPWRGYPAQRNRALALCAGMWVLFLDADERVTAALREEVGSRGQGDRGQGDKETKRQGDKETGDQAHQHRRTLSLPKGQSSKRGEGNSAQGTEGRLLEAPNPRIAGYWIPRRNIFFGRTLRGGGWYPDYQLRLLCRERARYDETRLVHELVQIDGATAHLNGHIVHYNIECLGEFWHKQTLYALAEARTLARDGSVARWRNFVGGPLRAFWWRYGQLGGWRDGLIGLFLCAALAWFELVKFAFLRGLH